MNDSVEEILHGIIYREGLSFGLSSDDIAIIRHLDQHRALTVLSEIYQSKSGEVYTARAYSAIILLREVDIVDWLLEMLRSPYTTMHITYCHDLSEYDDERSIAKLVEMLMNCPDGEAKGYIAELLEVYDHPDVIRALEYARDNFAHLDWQSIPVSDSAQWALGRIYSRRCSA